MFWQILFCIIILRKRACVFAGEYGQSQTLFILEKTQVFRNGETFCRLRGIYVGLHGAQCV
jgi:hypothetical protein